jgi:hypothetical protein
VVGGWVRKRRKRERERERALGGNDGTEKERVGVVVGGGKPPLPRPTSR